MKRKFTILLTMLMFIGTMAGGNNVMAENRHDTSMNNLNYLYKNSNPLLVEQEPEITAIMQKFIYADISSKVQLSTTQQELLKITVLTTSNTTDDLETYITGALNSGASATEIRETIYQCSPYIGYPKAKKALEKMLLAFQKNNINIPLENCATVDDSSRYENGLAVQTSIFGNTIRQMNETAPADQQHFNTYLSANCFGDYYTRTGLTLQQKELITFIAIASLGGCEPQLKAHAAANITVGNTRQNLLDAITVALPYIGYPRTLNALSCINETVPAK